jgi:hypothetical protein
MKEQTIKTANKLATILSKFGFDILQTAEHPFGGKILDAKKGESDYVFNVYDSGGIFVKKFEAGLAHHILTDITNIKVDLELK